MVAVTESEARSLAGCAAFLDNFAAAYPAGPYKVWAEDLRTLLYEHEYARKKSIRPGQRVLSEDGRRGKVICLWDDGAGRDCDVLFDDGTESRSHTSRLRPVIEPDSRHWRLHAHGLTEV